MPDWKVFRTPAMPAKLAQGARGSKRGSPALTMVRRYYGPAAKNCSRSPSPRIPRDGYTYTMDMQRSPAAKGLGRAF